MYCKTRNWKAKLRDAEKSKPRWWKVESTKLRWWNIETTMVKSRNFEVKISTFIIVVSLFWLFTIVVSTFHHRSFAFQFRERGGVPAGTGCRCKHTCSIFDDFGTLEVKLFLLKLWILNVRNYGIYVLLRLYTKLAINQQVINIFNMRCWDFSRQVGLS